MRQRRFAQKLPVGTDPAYVAQVRSLLTVCLLAGLAFASQGCRTAPDTRLTIVGVQPTTRAQAKLFVQFVNTTSRPLRLTEFNYTFTPAAGLASPSRRIAVVRDVEPGAAVIVEVLIQAHVRGQLRGTMVARADEVTRSLPVVADLEADTVTTTTAPGL